MSEENEAPLCSICVVDPASIECSGEAAHGFCRECFEGYAKANFEVTGEYERERLRDDDGLTSQVGQLPCPHFIQGSCTCVEIAPALLRRFVDDDTFRCWRAADVRIGMAASQKEQDQAEARQGEILEQQSPLDYLHAAVMEVFTRGVTVSCPECNTKGEKDEMCMHIKCESCNTEWCYCCGRRRGICTRESGCDSTSPFLENQPGWESFARGEESAGQGALHEFHRLRTTYFLKQLKQSTTADLWAELQITYPNVLRNVPTQGRNIEWDSIDDAELPTFGQTQPADVKWAQEGVRILADVEERARVALEDIELRTSRKNILQRRFASYMAHRIPTTRWTTLLIHVFLLVALLVASIVVENEIYKVVTASLLCVYVVLLMTKAVLFLVDWRYTTLLNLEDEWALPYAEVTFCGSREDLPYLATAGRWSSFKWLYVATLFTCLAFGSFLTVFFQHWSTARCLSLYGICGLGPALLVFAGMVFGWGTLLLNTVPPRERNQNSSRSLSEVFFHCGVMMPIGTYLMVGYKHQYERETGWVIGACIIGISASFLLADVSQRCFNEVGFVRVGFPRRHFFFWCFTIAGLVFLGSTPNEMPFIVGGCALTVLPLLSILIGKVCYPDVPTNN